MIRKNGHTAAFLGIFPSLTRSNCPSHIPAPAGCRTQNPHIYRFATWAITEAILTPCPFWFLSSLVLVLFLIFVAYDSWECPSIAVCFALSSCFTSPLGFLYWRCTVLGLRAFPCGCSWPLEISSLQSYLNFWLGGEHVVGFTGQYQWIISSPV